MALTEEQVNTLIVIERITASISVAGTLMLIATFTFIKEFRTLSNTLIFYASFANLFANVAALIGGSALSKLNGGLCQFQGFLLEMFMQSDPMWSCAMAINVYLVFFRRYDAYRLKRLYWIYGTICYGVPFIPALFCLLYKTQKKGRMYGNATLWCWIDNDWAAIRIYSYYAPIWLAILVALIIYLRVGIEIYQKRSQLRGVMDSGANTGGTFSNTAPPVAPMEPAFSGTRTTDIEVTTDSWKRESIQSSPSPFPDPKEESSGGLNVPKDQQYSITISAHPVTKSFPAVQSPKGVYAKRPSSMDKIKWAYTKCAMLFAISILITWVPASVNRVYGLRYPTHPSFALNVGSAIVLPLQGFWNTTIYFTTSLSICRTVWERQRIRGAGERVREVQGWAELDEREGKKKKKNGASESTVELSGARSVGSVGESF